MKRTVVSLILAVCLAFGIIGMTGCAYNWDDSKNAVSIDLAALKGSKIDAVDFAEEATAKLILDAYHDLRASNGTAKAALKDGDKIAAFAELTLTVNITRSLLMFETQALYTNSSYALDLGEYTAEGEPVDGADKVLLPLEKLIAKEIATRIAEGEELKVGETYTFSAPLKITYTDTDSDDTKDDNEYTFTQTTEPKYLSDIEFTITAAAADAPTVVVGATDILNLYFTKKAEDGTEIDTDYNWRYTSITTTSIPSSLTRLTYDPYYAEKQNEAAEAFIKALAEKIAAGEIVLTEAAEYRSAGDKVQKHDWVEVELTLEYKYKDKEQNDITDNIPMPATTVKTDLYCLTMSDTDLDTELAKNRVVHKYAWSNIVANLNKTEGDDVQKVGSTYTVPLEKLPETIYLDSDRRCFKTETKTGEDGKEVTYYTWYTEADAYEDGIIQSEWTKIDGADFAFKYKIKSAKGADWGSFTTVEGEGAEAKTVTYDYYIDSATALYDELTLEDLANSTLMNKDADKATNARYFYAYSYDETELDENGNAVLDENGNAKTVAGSKIYANSNYAITLFKTVEQADGSLKYYAYDEAAAKFSDTEGLSLMEGVIGDGETVDAEKRAVLYAIQKCLERDERAGCIRAIWAFLSENATIKMPKELLDQYYNEYYENQRYNFYVTCEGASSYKENDETIVVTDFTAYLLKALNITDETKIRETIDAKATAELSPRLLANALADMMGIEITDEDKKTIEENLEYGRQQNNYYYALYSAYGMGGYTYYDNVEDYATATYGSMEGVYTAVLHDKVLEALYDDKNGDYNFTYNFVEDPADE